MMNDAMQMVERETLGGDKVLVSYAETRRLAESERRESARLAKLRASWAAARGEAEDADPFAAFA